MLSTRPEHISEETIKQSYWVLSHLSQGKKIALRSSIIIEGLLFFLFFIQFSFYLHYAFTREATMVAPLRAFAEQSQQMILLAQPIVKEQGAVHNAPGLYDAFAIVHNENNEWRADFDVLFSINGADQPSVHAVLFPKEQKAFLLPAVTANVSPVVSSRIINISWKRLSYQEKSIILERTSIDVTTKTFSNTRQGQFIGSRLFFSLVNKSISHAYDFSVKAVVRKGTEIVGVKNVPIFSLLKGEERPFEARWEQPVDATSFELYPDIDYLDDGAFQRAL